MRTILSFLPVKDTTTPASAFLSAHPAAPSERPQNVGGISSLGRENPAALKWPIVVDWTGGQASIGDVDGVKGILEIIRKRRDGELKGEEIDQPKGWFS